MGVNREVTVLEDLIWRGEIEHLHGSYNIVSASARSWGRRFAAFILIVSIFALIIAVLVPVLIVIIEVRTCITTEVVLIFRALIFRALNTLIFR